MENMESVFNQRHATPSFFQRPVIEEIKENPHETTTKNNQSSFALVNIIPVLAVLSVIGVPVSAVYYAWNESAIHRQQVINRMRDSQAPWDEQSLFSKFIQSPENVILVLLALFASGIFAAMLFRLIYPDRR